MSLAKDDAKRIIKGLSDYATWDDIMYQFYIKGKISNSLKAAEEGKIMSHDDAKKRIIGKRR